MSPVFLRPACWLVLLLCCRGTLAAESPFDRFVASVATTSPYVRVRTEALHRAETLAGVASARPGPEWIIGTENLPVTGADAFDLRADPMTMVRFGLMQEVEPRARRERRGEIARQRVGLASASRAGATSQLARAIADAASRGQAARDTQARIAATRLVLDDIRARAQAQWTAGAGELAMLAEIEAMRLELDDADDEQAMALAEARQELARWVGADRVDEALGLALPETLTVPADARDAWIDRVSLMPEQRAAELRQQVAEIEAAEARQSRRPSWSWELTVADRGPHADDMVSLMVRIPLSRRSVQRARIDAANAKVAESEAMAADTRRELEAALEADLARFAILERRYQRLIATQWPMAVDRRDLARLETLGERAPLADWLAAEWALHTLALTRIERDAERRRLAASLNYRTIEVNP